MNRYSIIAAALLLASAPAFAAKGDAARGKEKSKTCAACHGETGLSASDAFPHLAGQHQDYLNYALRMYRAGAKGKDGRKNAIMAGNAAALTDQDIADLSAFYASQSHLSIAK